MEIWKDINSYEGYYRISNLGRVKSLSRTITRSDRQNKTIKEKILKVGLSSKGYPQINLCQKGKQKTMKIHRLVAQAFIPNPDNKPQINHKDGNKKNNVVSNLEWVTASGNIKHAYEIGLMPQGVDNTNAKMSAADVLWIRERCIPRDKEYGIKPLGERFGVGETVISRIVNNRTYISVI